MKIKFIIPITTVLLFSFGCKKDDIFLKANAGTDILVQALEQVILDGSNSTGPDGFTYLWEYNGTVPEEEINFQNKTSVNPNFTPPKTGLYAFTLTISFGDNTSEDVVLVEASGAAELGGTLETDTYLKSIEDDPDLADYYINTDLIVPEGITLTIEDNVTIAVASDVGIQVNGTLTNANLEDYFDDISFTSSAGWKGILVEGGTLDFEGLKIHKAGASAFEGQTQAAAILFTGDSPELKRLMNTEFINSFENEIIVETNVQGNKSLGDNIFSSKIPIKAPFNFVGHFSNHNSYSTNYEFIHLIPNDIEEGNSLPGNQFYFLYAGKYYIDGTLRAKSNFMTSAPVEIYMKENTSLIFEKQASIGNGYLESSLITGLDGAMWNGIALSSVNASWNSLDNLVIEKAGANPVVGGSVQSAVKAAVYIKGTVVGKINNCTIEDIDGYGLFQDLEDDEYPSFILEHTEFINTSMAAIRTNAVSVPSLIGVGVICNLPDNVPGCLIEQDGSPRGRYWPAIENGYYLIDADVTFNTSKQFIFNAGAHLKFKSNRSIEWIVNGSYDDYEIFEARGEESNPVIFEGEVDEPGSWGGMVLEGNFSFNHFHLKNGGGFLLTGASEFGNIYFDYKNYPPGDLWKTFTNCVVTGSAGYGIVFSDKAVDFDFKDPEKANIFSDNALGDIFHE